MNRRPDPSVSFPSSANGALHRASAVLLLLGANVAFAAGNNIGQGLIGWASNIILFLGFSAIVVGLVGAVFQPQLVKPAAFSALILVIVFFLLKNQSEFAAAVQKG